MKIVLPLLALLLIPFMGFADDATTALTAKGVKFKTGSDKTSIEVVVPATAALTLDDYKLLGQLKHVVKANLGAGALPLNDDTASALAGWDTIEVFFANGAELTDDGFKSLGGWKSLRQFGLDHWGWKPAAKDMRGAGLAHLAALPNLQIIRLGGCRIDNRAAVALATIATLQSVDVQHASGLTDDGVADLAKLPALRIIKLDPQFTPRITDASLAHLESAKNLEEIDLGETWLTYDAGFSHLKALTGLKKIVLTNVIAEDADIEKLKADHPMATITWTKPDSAVADKAKAAFKKALEKKGAK